MSAVKSVEPVKLFCGIIIADIGLLMDVKERLEALFGKTDMESDHFPFDCTDYYEKEMGEGLTRVFVAFEKLLDPGLLPDIKIRTNEIEREFSYNGDGERRRRVNVDPGYIEPSKLILATTKNFSHRLYLGQGIYGELTLIFGKASCRFFDWTYPDFESGDYLPFFQAMRKRYMQALAESCGGG